MALGSTSTAAPQRALRHQYRVGHGGFHATIVNPERPSSERLTYVYDVGAYPSVQFLEKSIDAFVDELVMLKIHTVDYIFISHIDTDHVNRLEYLLKRLKNSTNLPKSQEGSFVNIPVARVVIPWLSSVGKLLTRARGYPSAVLENLTGVDAEVDAYLKNLEVREIIRVGDSSVGPGSTFQSGLSLTQGHSSGWQLIPLWLPLGDREYKIMRCFLRELERKTRGEVRPGDPHHDPTQPAHHAAILRKYRPKVKSAMEKVAKEFELSHRNDITNWSSIAILAGRDDATNPCDLGNVNRDIVAECAHYWLHTGDLPLKSTTGFLQDLTMAMQPSAKMCVLVPPHHGSKHSHDPGLYAYVKGGTVLITTGKNKDGRYAKKVDPADAIESAGKAKATQIELLNR